MQQKEVQRRGSEVKLHQMDTESRDNATAVAMQDASTQTDFKLTTFVEALKEEVDAELKMFKICDSAAVDSSVDEDEMDYLSESSGGEAGWQFFGEASNFIKISLDYTMGLN